MKQPKECCPEMDSTPYLYYFIIYLTGALQGIKRLLSIDPVSGIIVFSGLVELAIRSQPMIRSLPRGLRQPPSRRPGRKSRL